MRAIVSSFPKTNIMSNTLGVTVFPAIAALNGPASLLKFVPKAAVTVAQVDSNPSRDQLAFCNCGVNDLNNNMASELNIFLDFSSAIIGRDVRQKCDLSRSS